MKNNYSIAARKTLMKLKNLKRSEKQRYLEKVNCIIEEVKAKKPRCRTLKEHSGTVKRLRASYLKWRRELYK